jgi:hypothetical protein
MGIIIKQQKTNTMNNLKKIAELNRIVDNADVSKIKGRGDLANACKELYNIIELDIITAGDQWLLPTIFNNLCNGNFAEPMSAHSKKKTFEAIVDIYKNNILPRI